MSRYALYVKFEGAAEESTLATTIADNLEEATKELTKVQNQWTQNGEPKFVQAKYGIGERSRYL